MAHFALHPVLFAAVAFFFLAFLSPTHSADAEINNDEKLTETEVVARHLKSIGTSDDLISIKTRVMTGTSLFTVRSPGTGQNSGLSILFSQDNKTVVAMSFSNPSYPHEKFGFDGSKVVIGYMQPGVRSVFGEFIYARSSIVKEGLLGGTLSTAWPLLSMYPRKFSLKYVGERTVDGRTAHVLRYFPRKGSDLEIRLFFDAETFRHVRTDYDQIVSPQIGGSPDASKENQRQLHYQLQEQFSDFKQEDGLTLPHTYKIKLMLERNSAPTYLAEWEMVLSKFSWNQPLQTSWFDVNAPQ